MTDRRLLTMLVTDVEGSTALLSAKGDAEAHETLQACDELVRQQVQKQGGSGKVGVRDPGQLPTIREPRCPIRTWHEPAPGGEAR